IEPALAPIDRTKKARRLLSMSTASLESRALLSDCGAMPFMSARRWVICSVCMGSSFKVEGRRKRRAQREEMAGSRLSQDARALFSLGTERRSPAGLPVGMAWLSEG